jgi:selenocysteine lyase/cysteine desulfurase
MPTEPLFDPADFRIQPGLAHLCAGGETAFLHRHDAALQRYAADKSSGIPGRAAQEAQVERARALAARAWGATPEDIGFVSSVAEGVSMLVESLDWQPGDAVCLDPDEYPSVALPALMRQGIEPLFVPMHDPEAVARAAGRRARLIAVSHVSYLTGRRYDLSALRTVADHVGALLVVDHTQAAGYLPIEAPIADFAFAATYKWLLGMTGTTIAYWNRARQPDWRPSTAGWHSVASMVRPEYSATPVLRPDAMRFTRGNPAHGPLYVLADALDYLAGFDPHAVQAHVQALTTELLARLRDRGIPSTTPAEPEHHGASVCIEHADSAAIVAALEQRGVLTWGGRGRLRVSFHGYNADTDLDALMAALDETRQG